MPVLAVTPCPRNSTPCIIRGYDFSICGSLKFEAIIAQIWARILKFCMHAKILRRAAWNFKFCGAAEFGI
ncbi:hypothetical protein [uncultured Campylobacter sp.]|uniref:hypothetical protein n=1 Tax=uncultured Campylobacter sp. TaxID=218934 RepID=UPI0026206353|nr:hypothetical protein [uncultured Campylobacter sp.]